ncbi:MAG TPA: DUF2155 domain-containing protein [Azospirillaceae bacterium]|nr:DUF2155 domain-containing protein [Azospirillaceae bacterium]
MNTKAAYLVFASAVAAACWAGVPAAQQRVLEPRPVAVLQGLDKGTARTSTFEVKVGTATRFGSLTVRVEACRQAPPIEPPETAAFLEIWENQPSEPPRRVFSGWMFASSPALSALEHPVYDVWVKDCRNESTTSIPASDGNTART